MKTMDRHLLRRFWNLATPYWREDEKWTAWGLLALLVLLLLGQTRFAVLLNEQTGEFTSALAAHDADRFWGSIKICLGLLVVAVPIYACYYFVRDKLGIYWRRWLTNRFLGTYFSQRHFYELNASTEVDNPDQRIQQDVESFVSSTLTLSMGLLDAVVSLFSFTLILWNLSGVLEVFGWEIPRAMVFAVYLYVIAATVFAIKIGRPLIQLNFLNEKLGANFRYALMRLREYGESIAFYRGEKVERVALMRRFRDVIVNLWAIIFRSVKFQGFNLAVSQAAVVFPFVVQAPRLLSKQITLGDVMQTAESFSQVQNALSFIRTSYDNFAGYRAIINRLAGFLESMNAARKLPSARVEADDSVFAIESLTVRTPAGELLVDDLTLTVTGQTSILIRGKSGIGKTTLLRALAGLWPHAEGRIRRPVGKLALFLPQKPYLPLGTLRAALYYPAPARDHAQATEVLRRCHLGHLVNALDDVDDWSRRLSLGEQQRLAIGRVLLNRPRIVFLDEASSAMDEGLEHAMYQIMRESLPETITVSVGHRSTLIDFHTRELELLGGGRWHLRELGTAVTV